MEENTLPKVTLCMIVKNESHIIKEGLTTLLPYIKDYEISDTGSTDNTKETIMEFFKQNNIPGKHYHIARAKTGYSCLMPMIF